MVRKFFSLHTQPSLGTDTQVEWEKLTSRYSEPITPLFSCEMKQAVQNRATNYTEKHTISCQWHFTTVPNGAIAVVRVATPKSNPTNPSKD